MFCEKCGAPLEEGKQFCVNCGAKNEAPAAKKPAREVKLPKMPKIKLPTACPLKKLSVASLLPYTWKALGILVGVIILIMGICVMSYDASSIYVAEVGYSSYSFGGDFYTYMYEITEKATEQLNNIAAGMERMSYAMGQMTDAILNGIGSILIALGMVVTLVSAAKPVSKKHCCCKKEEAPAEAPAEEPAAE